MDLFVRCREQGQILHFLRSKKELIGFGGIRTEKMPLLRWQY